MLNISLTVTLAKLPVAELQASIRKHVEPMTENLPDKWQGEGGDTDEIVLCLHNVTDCSQSIDLELKASKIEIGLQTGSVDIISGQIFPSMKRLVISMQPYHVLWLFSETL